MLDSTHLRFFTRGSVHETFREAGLVPVDMRRTTAGVFDTEIDVRREDFEQGIVDAVEGDPESTTYQFVLRAVPQDSHDGDDMPMPRSGLPRPADRCRVGIWARVEPDDLRQALILRVTHAELARRLPGATIRAFSSCLDVRPSPHDGGIPIEALGSWSPERANALAMELDCVVVAGALPEPDEAEMDGGRRPARFLLEGPGRQAELECPVLWSAVRLPETPLTALGGAVVPPVYRAVLEVSPLNQRGHSGDESTVAVPDPLLLVTRLLPREALARRLEFVRIMGWFPPDRPAVVVEMGGSLLPYADEVARALDRVVAGSDASVVLVQIHPGDQDGGRAADVVARTMTSSVYRVPGDALADDLVAVIANAAAFAPCSASGTALGLAYERTMAYVDVAGDSSVSQLASISGNLGAVVTRPIELEGLLDSERFRPTGGVVAKLQFKLDAHFDRLAAFADAAAAARPRTPGNRVMLPPSEYMAAIELAHRRMQERLDAERRAVANHLRDLRKEHDADLEALRAERESAEAELRNRLDRAVRELEALQGIRVLRLLRPARAAYARLRGQRL